MSDSSFSQDPQVPEKPRKSNMALWIILGVVLGGGLICFLCCGGMAMFGWNQIGKIADVVKDQVQDDPVVQEHLGDLTSASFNMTKTGEYSQEHPESQNVLAIDVRGSKGSGVLYCEPVPGGKITLKTDSGEYELPTDFDPPSSL